jgi:membrane protease YdiL (CAAX protease family)
MSQIDESLSPRSRALSAIEFLFGGFIVLGHNVFRILPNEVPLLLVVGVLSIFWRNGGWTGFGLARPRSWTRTVLIALAAAGLRIVMGEFVVEPFTNRFWPPPIAPAGAETITGNPLAALLALLLVWTFAAFGEELSYRGYLLLRCADVGCRSAAAYWIGVVLVSILFGYGHYYKGPSGIVDSGVAGLILGAAFILSGRNLWSCILAHGFIDTFGVMVLYFGWQS